MQQTLQLLHEIVWGPWTIFLFLWTGLFFTVRSGGFQVRGLSYWWKKTVGSLWQSGVRTEKQRESAADEDRRRAASDKITVSAFQTSCTALAATIGTGNIVGVATALTAGGPGAVFWLWISALIGMATAYAETSLGQKYRYRGPDGTWQCGPMAVMERGLGCRSMGLLYAFFAVLASLGMGSMVQANAVSETLRYEAGMKPETAAVLVTALTAAVVWGGIRRISRMTSWFVPLSAGIYFFFSVWVLVMCRRSIPVVLLQIIKEAWTPGEQGMWAMFEVFFDTIVICTLTALVILCVGRESALTVGGRVVWPMTAGHAAAESQSLQAGLDGAALTSFCFTKILGRFGGILVSGSMASFAFATILGWYYIGRQMFSYLAERLCSGADAEYFYTILYLLAVWLGCVCRLDLVWIVSDLVNGLMAYPNLLTLWLLAGKVRFPEINRKVS